MKSEIRLGREISMVKGEMTVIWKVEKSWKYKNHKK